MFSTNKNREIRRDHHCVESRSGLWYNLPNLEASIWYLQLLYSMILRWSYEGVGSPSGAISHARMLDIFVFLLIKTEKSVGTIIELNLEVDFFTTFQI